jgi:hypothetical protein
MSDYNMTRNTCVSTVDKCVCKVEVSITDSTCQMFINKVSFKVDLKKLNTDHDNGEKIIKKRLTIKPFPSFSGSISP